MNLMFTSVDEVLRIIAKGKGIPEVSGLWCMCSPIPKGICFPGIWQTFTEISDKSLRLSLGHSISSLRTPVQTQRSGVAARIPMDAKRHRLLSVGAFLSSTVRRYGGCARDTFGYAGFPKDRSANLRTAATPIASRRSMAAPLSLGASQ